MVDVRTYNNQFCIAACRSRFWSVAWHDRQSSDLDRVHLQTDTQEEIDLASSNSRLPEKANIIVFPSRIRPVACLDVRMSTVKQGR